MKKVISWLAIVSLITLMLGGCKSSSTDDTDQSSDTSAQTSDSSETKEVEINVFIAASLANSMDEIKENYEAEHPNVTIIYNADSSGKLQTQIEEGADCDVFFSAATKQMDALVDEGLVEEDNVVDLLQNSLVLIKPSGEETEVTSFETVTNAANIAIGAEDVPAGQYARVVFENLGILDEVMAMEVNEGASVTAVLTSVSEKSNEVGVVYATDAASMEDSVEIIDTATSEEMGGPAVYPVSRVENMDTDSDSVEAADEFVSYLSSDEALAVFEDYGFGVN